MVRANAITRDSEKYKELKSQLSRAFGQSKKIEPDFFKIDLYIGDYILLCSDGLSNMVDDNRILEIVKEDTSIEQKVDNLIIEANKNGGRDNIAIILICIDSINRENSVFETERRLLKEEMYETLKGEKQNLKDILSNRLKNLGNENFHTRSRKKKEGSTDEDK